MLHNFTVYYYCDASQKLVWANLDRVIFPPFLLEKSHSPSQPKLVYAVYHKGLAGSQKWQWRPNYRPSHLTQDPRRLDTPSRHQNVKNITSNTTIFFLALGRALWKENSAFRQGFLPSTSGHQPALFKCAGVLQLVTLRVLHALIVMFVLRHGLGWA